MPVDEWREQVSWARTALELRRLDEAERAARGALALDPAAEEGHALLARVHLARDEHVAMLRVAEAGIRAVPESEWLHRIRAIALNGLGRREEALAATDEALRLQPDVAATYFFRSWILRAMKDLPGARLAAARAVELEPEDAEYHAQLGDLWRAEDPWQAGRHYRDSLRLDPERPATLNSLGIVLEQQGRTREAALAFRSAVMLDPTLTVAKQNTHAAVDKLVGGGFAVSLVAVLQLVRGIYRAERIPTESSGETFVFLICMVAVWGVTVWAVWRWRRRKARRRLEQTDPELLAIYEKLEADRKAGRLG